MGNGSAGRPGGSTPGIVGPAGFELVRALAVAGELATAGGSAMADR